MLSRYYTLLWLVSLFSGGLFLSSCETAPTDFDVEPAIDIPLGKVQVSQIEQYIVARDYRFQQDFGIAVNTEDFEVLLSGDKGRLKEVEGRSTLDLDLESHSLSESNYSVLYAVTGSSVIGFHIQLEGTVLHDEHSPSGSDPAFCTTTNATLILEKQEDYPPFKADTIHLPITAVLRLSETENSNNDPVLEGNLQIMYHNPIKPISPQTDPAIVFYSLEAKIRIE